MRPLRFCASCGHELEGEADGGARCPRCGRVWYRNPAPTVGAAIVDRGKALITVRAHPPHQGRVDVPGGFVQHDETPLQALRRELREELGVEIDVGESDYLQAARHEYDEEGTPVIALGYRARITGGELKPADDVAEVRWVGREELDQLDFAWEHDRELLDKALARATTAG